MDNILKKIEEKEETRVFYLKMKGDYYRYLAEVFKDKESDYAKQSEDSYNAAYELAVSEMPSTHPIRLGLALNFSVFYYEINNTPDKACELAKKVMDCKYCTDELTFCFL